MKEQPALIHWLEAVLLTAAKALTEEQLLALWPYEPKPSLATLRQGLHDLSQACQTRAIELQEVATGYRFQIKAELAPGLEKLFEEKPQRYSRALLETLALIAYRQPITRGEIEEIRGVSVSSSIFKTLQEDREWIRVVGHRAVPGRPALYATSKAFLDHFGLKNLDQLPLLPELKVGTEEVSGLEPALADQLSLQFTNSAESEKKSLADSELENIDD